MALRYITTKHLRLGPGGRLLAPGTEITDASDRDLGALVDQGAVVVQDDTIGGGGGGGSDDIDIAATTNTVPAAGATETLDGDVSRYHELTLDANLALTVSNLATGEQMIVVLEQDGTGGRSVTMTGELTDGGADVLAGLTTTAGAISVLTLLQTSHGLMVLLAADDVSAPA